MQIAQLSLLLIWNLHGCLNSFSLIANPSLLPLDDIVLKKRSLSDLKCSDCRVADIIEPARSPWMAQVHVVKQGERNRLVIDYSVAINRFTLFDAYPL